MYQSDVEPRLSLEKIDNMTTGEPDTALPVTRSKEVVSPFEPQQPVLIERASNSVQSHGILPGLLFQPKIATANGKSGPDQYWSHELYHGPNNEKVKILYSSNRNQSEEIAKQFLGEQFLGFDLEWDWRRNLGSHVPLRDRIGLIQIACEDKIALFHIGLHVGKTTEELLAPSLRAIIESPTITKAGVHIMKADMSRFRQWFGIEPRGAFELSHLHNLVMYGGSEPEECSTKVVKLATQVEVHLGMPLLKGEERTSTWSCQLNDAQKKYAAADAYAGYMLYHRMNEKRLAMQPPPPIPVHADSYTRTGKYVSVLLQLSGTETVSALDFFQPVAQPDSSPSVKAKSQRRRTSQKTEAIQESEIELLDPELSSQLLLQLKAHRTTTASKRRCAPYMIAHDKVLQDISQRCPRNEDDLLRIRNIGPVKCSEHGPAWLEIVRGFLADAEASDHSVKKSSSSSIRIEGASSSSKIHEAAPQSLPSSMVGSAEAGQSTRQDRPPATLRTGLSFSLESTNLYDNNDSIESGVDANKTKLSPGRDDTKPRTPSPSAMKRKSDEFDDTSAAQPQRATKMQ